VDFTSFTPGVLYPQNGWKDYGAGADDFLIDATYGLMPDEDTWSTWTMARDTTACALSQPDSQYAYWIHKDKAGANGEKFGVVLRANATGDTFVYCTYNEGSTQFESGHMKGATQTGVSNVSYTVADTDSITAKMKGDSLLIFDGAAQIGSLYSATWPSAATAVYLGVSANGDLSGNGWGMIRWGGGEPE
jgi:hypothetical protein